MGMYDNIYFKCKKCGRKVVAQSKGGDCSLTSYHYKSVPYDVALDANRHRIICECGQEFRFELPKELTSIRLKAIRIN